MNGRSNVTQHLSLPPDTLLSVVPCGTALNSAEKSANLFILRKNDRMLDISIRHDQKDYVKKCAEYYAGGYARYEDVLPETDFYGEIFDKEVACKLIAKKPAQTTFPFVFKMQNVYLKRVKNNRYLIFADQKTNEAVFLMPAPLVMDDNGEMCPTVNYVIQENADGAFVTLKPNQAWMKAKKRSFPIVVCFQIRHTSRLSSPLTHFDDLSAMELRFPIGMQHHFMPLLSENLDYNMQIGTGWRLNIMQSITPHKNKQGEIIAYNYLDGEGKHHILPQKSACNNRIGSPREAIGKLNVYYTYCCELNGAYDDGLHAYHDIFPLYIQYDPELRLLKRDALHHYFDKDGRLVRIVNDRRIALNIDIKNGRIHEVSNHHKKFRFAYRSGKLAAIITPKHDCIRYKYDANQLIEVEFPNGKKLKFCASD